MRTIHSSATLTHGGGYRAVYGSSEHPHIQYHQWKPYYKALRRYVVQQLRKRDADTLLLRAESEQVLNTLYARPQHIRNGTPQERADAILGNVYKQQQARRYYTRNPRRRRFITPALNIVLRMASMDVCLKYSGLRPRGTEDRPRYRWVQLARTCYINFLKADRHIYTRDDGHGNVREVVKVWRLRLQSWWVCRRISERLEPVYRWYVHDHGSKIASLVPR